MQHCIEYNGGGVCIYDDMRQENKVRRKWTEANKLSGRG